MPTPDFLFDDSANTTGTVANSSASGEYMHPFLPTSLVPSGGQLVILNGWNQNRIMSDVVGSDGATSSAVRLLQITPPTGPLVPIISAPGAGNIFGRGLKWRWRWKNHITGEFSGLSPSPDDGVNLGVELTNNGFLGQDVYFTIDTSSKPGGVTVVQLFRNTTDEEGVWYLVDETDVSSANSVTFHDNYQDSEIMTAPEVVSVSVPSGPTIDEGVMPPVAKAFRHPTGRLWYYGIRRMGRWIHGRTTFSGYPNGQTVTLDDWTDERRYIHAGRIGQRLSLTSWTNNTTTYRITAAINSYTFTVTPPLTHTSSSDQNTAVTAYGNIEDDRDARWIYQSEPGVPWLIDPLKTMAFGHDFDDAVCGIFSLGATYVQTKTRIYRLINDSSEDPSLSVQSTVVSEEGMTGLEAGVATPYGWVYFNPVKGVRVFDGQNTYSLGGSGDPYEDFLPRTQISRMDSSYLEDVRLFYDADHHTIYVSYVPSGSTCHEEALIFSANDRVWRGPYRMRLTAAGQIRSTTTDEVTVFGDDQGNLMVPEAQVLDHIDQYSGQTLSGTIATVDRNRVLTVSGATFDPASDNRLRGAIVWFTDQTDWWYSHIAYVHSATKLELVGPPRTEAGVEATLTVGWEMYIGTVRWSLTTAYIDGGEPIQPKNLQQLRVRYEYTTGSDTYLAAVARDGSSTYEGEYLSSTSAPEMSSTTTYNVYDGITLARGGRCFTIRFRGSARSGDPHITGIVADIDIRGGA